MPTNALNTKSNKFCTTRPTVDDKDGWLLLYSYLPVDAFMDGLRLEPMRRTQIDIDGGPPLSDDVAQTMVDHSSSE